MKKWIVGYWDYKNDQWEDKEKEALANTFDEVFDIIRVFTPNAKIRYIHEVNNFTENKTTQEMKIGGAATKKYRKRNNYKSNLNRI